MRIISKNILYDGILMRKIILFLIRFYQKTVSPDHGIFPVLQLLGRCRHEPTCSQYAYRAVEEHGVVKGGWLGIKRVWSCR